MDGATHQKKGKGAKIKSISIVTIAAIQSLSLIILTCDNNVMLYCNIKWPVPNLHLL